jgi:hypothetical protein
MHLGEFYPNPASQNPGIALQWSSALDLQVTVYDIMGRRIHEETWRPGSGKTTKRLDVTDLPAGVYQVQFTAPSLRLTRRLSIEK